MSSSSDNVFFAQGAITVTQTRFVAFGDTYAMSNVSSCRTRYTVEVNKLKQFLLYAAIVASLVIGVILAFSANEIVGAIIGIAGVVASFVFIKPKFREYHLYLGTNSGELRALDSRNRDLINQVERAVNDAIVARG